MIKRIIASIVGLAIMIGSIILFLRVAETYYVPCMLMFFMGFIVLAHCGIDPPRKEEKCLPKR